MSLEPCGITVVGLGPGDPALRTLAAQRALDGAARIVLRTRVHPGLGDLSADPRVTDCDDLYQSSPTFEVVYQAIADRVIAQAKRSGHTVFAVPGHPRFGERSVQLIEAQAQSADIPLEVQDGVSFVDAVVGALAEDPIAGGLQIVDAVDLAAALDAAPFAAGLLALSPLRPLLVCQVYNSALASAAKLALARLYPDDTPVTIVRAATLGAQEREIVAPLHTLDRQNVDHLTSLWVPAKSSLDALRSPDALLRTVARLRRPDGCPWDREQSHATLRDAILEEAYETVDAIDGDDADALAEELGDLLLLVAMHAQIAEEAGSFTFEDICEGIAKKLIRRHPHVFSTVIAESPDAVIATWNLVKAAERAVDGLPRDVASPIDRLPRSMPAMRKAIELLAPGKVLAAPDEPDAGDDLLRSIRALIDCGVDPERALENSLRTLAATDPVASDS